MVKVTSSTTVAVTGDGKGDAKVAASATENLMVETTGDSGSDRQWQQLR